MVFFRHFISVFSEYILSLGSHFGKSNPRDKGKVTSMLSYWKDGKEIILSPIGRTGVIGQIVILGEKVDWGKIPDTKEYPISLYPYLSVFTIINKNTHPSDEYYILRDSEGIALILRFKNSGNISYLYDAQEWLKFNAIREAEKLSRKQRKIEQLEGHVDLLKDILIKQGTRIVTEKQASTLGLKG